MSPDEHLAAIASQNHGVIPTNLARAIPLSRYQIDKRIERGTLVRVHEKALAVAGAPTTWSYRAAAALAALPNGSLGFNSAARLHSMDVPNKSTPITVTGPDSLHHELEGVVVRRSKRLRNEHTTVVQGLRVTSRTRTIVDLAADLSDGRIQRLIEDELSSGRSAWDEMERAFVTSAKRGRKGSARMRRVMGKLEGETPTESALERRFLDVLDAAGFPRPTVQGTAPWADDEPGRVDMLYAEERLVVELDGRRFHARFSAMEEDRRRDQLAVMNGHRTIRFGHRQVYRAPESVLAVLTATLGA